MAFQDEFTEVYHVVGADTKAIVPIDEGTDGLTKGEEDAGSASINTPAEDPLAVAAKSGAQTNPITSPADTSKVTCEYPQTQFHIEEVFLAGRENMVADSVTALPLLVSQTVASC